MYNHITIANVIVDDGVWITGLFPTMFNENRKRFNATDEAQWHIENKLHNFCTAFNTWVSGEEIMLDREEALAEWNSLTFCEVDGCHNVAEWRGWHKVKDFTGNPTGLIQRRLVCDEHKHLLNGGESAQS